MTKQYPALPSRQKIYVRDMEDGVRLEAEVSPCVFMYVSYPLQITITLQRSPSESLGVACTTDHAHTGDSYTVEDVTSLLATVRTCPCHRCSSPAFDPTTVRTNRGGLCERCFLKALDSEWAQEQSLEQRKIAARDRQMKQRGMVFRVTAWVHKQNGKDDYLVDFYFPARPSDDAVRSLLQKKGSSITDDYQVIDL